MSEPKRYLDKVGLEYFYNKMKNQIDAQLSPQIETATGTSLQINDAIKLKLDALKGNTTQEVIEAEAGTEVTGTDLTISDYNTAKESKFTKFGGNTEQKSYTGKNLFDYVDEPVSKYLASTTPLSNGVRITQTSSATIGVATYKLGGSELLGKQITIQSIISSSGTNAPIIRFFYGNDENRTRTDIYGDLTQTGSVTINIKNSFGENEDGIYMCLYSTYQNQQDAGVYVDYTNIQAEIGYVATSFESFVRTDNQVQIQTIHKI